MNNINLDNFRIEIGNRQTYIATDSSTATVCSLVSVAVASSSSINLIVSNNNTIRWYFYFWIGISAAVFCVQREVNLKEISDMICGIHKILVGEYYHSML